MCLSPDLRSGSALYDAGELSVLTHHAHCVSHFVHEARRHCAMNANKNTFKETDHDAPGSNINGIFVLFHFYFCNSCPVEVRELCDWTHLWLFCDPTGLHSCSESSETWLQACNVVTSFTLDGDLAQGACIAGRTRGEAHVLARIICCHVVQDECAGTVRVFNDDVMRVRLHGTAVWVQQMTAVQALIPHALRSNLCRVARISTPHDIVSILMCSVQHIERDGTRSTYPCTKWSEVSGLPWLCRPV